MVSKDPARSETSSQEMVTTRTLNAETLTQLDSFDAAIQALVDAGLSPTPVSEYGDGFEVLDEKEKGQLVNQPFVILASSLNPDGEYGEYISLRIMTKDGRKLVLNDGSTGIKDQAKFIMNERPTLAGLVCAKGLRSSDFSFCENCKTVGKRGAAQCSSCGHSPMKPATTYYLDVSK